MKRILYLVLTALVVITTIVSVTAGFDFNRKKTPVEIIAVENAPDSLSNDTLVIAGVGDMMLGTNYPSTSYLPPNDGQFLLDEVDSILRSADVTFGNCEGTFLDSGGTVKQCEDPAKCYAFRQPLRYANYLADAGFDLISLANNHSGDFGPQGRTSSIRVLSELGMSCAGLEDLPSVVIEREGVKYGLAAFAPNSGTADIRQIDKAAEIVKQLAKECDIVIVSFHGGAEGPDHQHITKKTEMFYGENRGNVYDFAHRMIDAGADIIFGHGPHVTRAVELYKDRLIAYSLGNFCTYARFNLSGPNGLAPLLLVKVNRSGEFIGGRIIPVKQEGEGGPQIDPEKKVIIKLQELCKSDFPENNLHIADDGILSVTHR